MLVQSPGGPLHMRNSAHVKKFIPTAVTTGVGDITCDGTEAVQDSYPVEVYTFHLLP